LRRTTQPPPTGAQPVTAGRPARAATPGRVTGTCTVRNCTPRGSACTSSASRTTAGPEPSR
jgi:hypothetical protein